MGITAEMVKELRDKTGAGMMDCKKALVANDADMEKSVEWLREKGIAKAEKKVSRIAAEGLGEIVISGNKAVVYELNCETDFVAKNDIFKELLEKIGNALVASDATCTDCALELNVEGKTISELLLESTAKIGEKLTLRNVKVFTKNDNQVFGSYKHNGGKIVVLTIANGNDQSVAKDIAMHVAALDPQYLDQTKISADFIEHEKDILIKETQNDPKAQGKPLEIIEKMVAGRLNKNLKEMCLVNQLFVKNPEQTVEQFLQSKKMSLDSFYRLVVGQGIEKKEVDFVTEVMSQIK